MYFFVSTFIDCYKEMREQCTQRIIKCEQNSEIAYCYVICSHKEVKKCISRGK